MTVRRRYVLLTLAAIVLFAAGTSSGVRAAPQSGQQTFSSPQAAVRALVKAAKTNDEAAMLHILGRDARRIVSSGDPVEDAENRARFVERYVQMHRLVNEPDGATHVYIGAENWPLPIPLVHAGRAWYFDTDQGRREILYRRIGRNELSAIRVCEALANAQKEYHAMHGEYAQKIFSESGRRNGLQWQTAPGEPRSPIGPLVASAVTTGPAPRRNGAPTPFRGYLYHTLLRQGPSAPGGAKSYLVGEKMTLGFAFVAYPAEYRSSGVMTFIVDSDGIVYQKDLGKSTTQVARAMDAYDPDASWQRSGETGEVGETAAHRPSR